MSPNDEILVVDDEVEIVAFIAELLAEEGYTIRTAYDGAQALETIAAHPPALVLTDHSMPRMTGADVLLQLRQSGSTLPIIVMSAEGQAELFLARGANAFLHKPFDLDTLLACVAVHYAPLIEATLASEEPSNVALRTHELPRARAIPPALRQILATSRRLRWDARWLSATSRRLQQHSQRLQRASERLQRQSGWLFHRP
ncbi:MAG: response regulator [Roseiflexaceae bacterium]